MGKILIVDDKTENLYLLQSLLETSDIDTITARNGAEALDMARKNNPDLIISDILMPVMDGFTLCRECKKDKDLGKIPFYFYTATYTDTKDEEYALSLGAERFIRKPIEPDDFIKIINEFYRTAGKKKSSAIKPVRKSESIVLKEYNEVLVRKVEDKMLQTEKAEKKLREYSEKLEKEISERKKNEASLEESKLLFQTLANISPVGIFRTDLDGDTTFVNPKWCEMAGISQEEALGKAWLKAVHPDDKETLSKKWSADSSKRLESTAEYRFLKPDGNVVWVLGKAVPEIADNSIIGYVGTITDITERKLSENKLRSSEERLKILFDYAPDAYYLNDVKGNFVDGNIAAEKLLGYSRHELIGKNLLKLNLLSARDIPRVTKLLIKNSLGQSTGPDTFTLTRKDKSKVTVEIITHPVKIVSQTYVLGIARDISERIRSEKALTESETKYRQLVSQSPDGIFIVDFSGRFLSVNKAMCNKLKYTEDELCAMKLLDIVPKKYHSVHKKRLADIKQGKSTTTSAEYEVTGKNGTTYFVEVLSAPYYKENKIIGFQGIARDISERKKADEILKKSQSQLENALKTAHMGAWEYDVKNDVFSFNDLFYAIFRTTAEKVGGYTMSSSDYASHFVHPDDISMVGEEIRNALEADDPDYSRQLEHRIIFPDGEIGYITVRFSIIKNEKGETVKTYGVNQDITERRNIENKIIESETYYRTLFEAANDAIFIMSGNTFIECNEKTISMFGCTRKEDIINHHPWEFSPRVQPDGSDSREKATELNKTVMAGKPQRFYWKHVKKTGEPFDAEISLNRIEVGEKKFIQALVTDISDHKKAEEDLIKAKEKAEESDRLKTAFLHNISHEIRTPMNAIVGFSALMTEPDIDTTSRQKYIDVITQSSNQLLGIVSDIIEISNIEAGIFKMTKTDVNVNSLLKSIHGQFVPKASEKDIGFTFSTPLNDSEAVIITDKTKLVQILTNLVNNALKFTGKGQIDFGYVVKKEDIEFYVSDTGIGINEEMYTRIFDRFYQVESKVSRQFEGTGLGLSICKAYVELLGGKIWLASEVGKGSVFYFTLPYTKPIPTVKAEEKTISQEKTKEEQNKEKVSRTILIAEDEKNNYLLLVEMLSSFNAEIIHAVNGKEAVEICREKKIDLVIMDIKMPVMDGYTATKEIKKFLPDLPVIALTAYAYESDRDEAINSGCNDYLAKPVLKIMLLETVKKYL